MDVVFVASEAVPFAKTGGLADVAGAAAPGPGKERTPAGPVPAVLSPRPPAGAELRDTGVTLDIPVGARVVEGRSARLACRTRGSWLT